MLLSAPAQAKTQECIVQAARFHGVNETVLRAIAFHESSMKTWEIRRNTNGSYDIGLMQINTVHLAELAKHGIGPAHLQDGCVSAFVGAWMYRKKIERHGNTWKAVGAYHSETPEKRDAYARRIHKIVQGWLATP